MHLDINFADVPDKIQPIPAGTYRMRISAPPTVQEAKSGKGKTLGVQLSVEEEGPFKNRVVFDYIPVWTDMGKIKIKQLCKSAGVEVGAGGLDPEGLFEKVVKVLVSVRQWKNDETGDDEEGNGVKKYLTE